jgi:copper(I)-binding protein
MFIDIAGPFTEGQSIPLTLTFEKAGAVETALVVSKSAPAGAAADGLGMKMEGH